MNTQIFSTDGFKKGDLVWLCAIEFHNSGRLRYNVKPVSIKIKEVMSDRIELDTTGHYLYNVPNTYRVSTGDKRSFNDYYYKCDLGLHISKTKEEAIEKYNNLLRDAIEARYEAFKTFERATLSKLL